MVKKLMIAMLAPLAETVPPKAYGGIELVIANLAEELTLRGHEVTVFCAAGSKVKAKVYPVSPMPLRSIKVLSIPAAMHFTI
jgi:glycosyltransferase involved in cell wall biosynthesis